MREKKEDYLYPLSFKGQTIYYYDDTRFANHPKTNKSYVKVSSLSKYIEEFSSLANKEDFALEGVLEIYYSTSNFEEIPLINRENSLVKLIARDGIENDGQKTSDLYVQVNLTCSLESIMAEIEWLAKSNEFFTMPFFLLSKGLNSIEHLKNYIVSEKLFMMNEEHAFMALEYSHVRKNLKFDKKDTFRYLTELYKKWEKIKTNKV